MLTQLSSSRRYRTIGLASLGGLLVWLVLTHTLAAYLADAAPETALILRPGDPTALLNIANARLNQIRAQAAANAGTPAPAPRTVPARLGAYTGSDPSFQADTGLPDDVAATPDLSQTDWVEAVETKPKPARVAAVDKQLLDQIGNMAEAALAADPLNSGAAGLLGQIAQAGGADQARTGSLMRAAATRSLHETLAVAWLMQQSYEHKDYAGAVYWAGAIMQTRPQLAQYVVPTLAQIAEDPAASGALDTVLASNPVWRGRFFATLPPFITDARTPLRLLLNLKDTVSPPATTDLRGYLDFLISHQRYEVAYYTWLQFLPPDQLATAGLIVNGSFERPPGGLAFDWIIGNGSGVSVDITERPGDDTKRALSVEFGQGRAVFPGVRQVLMLPPGTYQLTGEYKGQVIGRRGLIWRVLCLDVKPVEIGASPMFLGVARTWTSFDVPLRVPPTGCRAQSLQLELGARSASERLVTGTIWYDDLKIVRNPDVQTPG